MAEVNEIEIGQFEVLIQKQFGGGETLTIRTRCGSEQEAQKSVDKLYKGVVKDRASTFAKEVADYQIEMDRANAEIVKNDKVFDKRGNK